MMKKSQPDLTPSGVLETMAKLIRLTEKLNVEWSHWSYLANNVVARQNLADYLKKGCPKINNNGEVLTLELPKGTELARLILADDFISPEQIAKTYGFSYSNDQLEYFADTLPDMDTIIWLRANGYMLIAGPATDMNIMQVRDLDNQLFYSKTEGWYAEKYQSSAPATIQTDMVKAGQWLMIRKNNYPDSFNQTWSNQEELLTYIEHVPNATQVSYAVTAYYKVRNVYLLQGYYVRTSSVSADGNHVYVGDFDGVGLGLGVGDYWGNRRNDGIGISSARN